MKTVYQTSVARKTIFKLHLNLPREESQKFREASYFTGLWHKDKKCIHCK